MQVASPASVPGMASAQPALDATVGQRVRHRDGWEGEITQISAAGNSAQVRKVDGSTTGHIQIANLAVMAAPPHVAPSQRGPDGGGMPVCVSAISHCLPSPISHLPSPISHLSPSPISPVLRLHQTFTTLEPPMAKRDGSAWLT